jgi:hypothetical protein
MKLGYIYDSDNQKNQEGESSCMERDWERQISNYIYLRGKDTVVYEILPWISVPLYYQATDAYIHWSYPRFLSAKSYARDATRPPIRPPR